MANKNITKSQKRTFSDNPNYEKYKGIVLDPETNKFKIVSGLFTDKKDFYEKMYKRGLVSRKVFEADVFDWIKKNAKNTLDAYMLFSTAFSKWKGNNMLSDYYVKLLNDIPRLNREKQKGNPNTRGKDESTIKLKEDLTDLYPYFDGKDPYYVPKLETVNIYPIKSDGTLREKPLTGQFRFNDDDNKKYYNPIFWDNLYKLFFVGDGILDNGLNKDGYIGVEIEKANKPDTRIILTANDITNNWISKGSNGYVREKTPLQIGSKYWFNMSQDLLKQINAAKENGASQEEIKALVAKRNKANSMYNLLNPNHSLTDT